MDQVRPRGAGLKVQEMATISSRALETPSVNEYSPERPKELGEGWNQLGRVDIAQEQLIAPRKVFAPRFLLQQLSRSLR